VNTARGFNPRASCEARATTRQRQRQPFGGFQSTREL